MFCYNGSSSNSFSSVLKNISNKILYLICINKKESDIDNNEEITQERKLSFDWVECNSSGSESP